MTIIDIFQTVSDMNRMGSDQFFTITKPGIRTSYLKRRKIWSKQKAIPTQKQLKECLGCRPVSKLDAKFCPISRGENANDLQERPVKSNRIDLTYQKFPEQMTQKHPRSAYEQWFYFPIQ